MPDLTAFEIKARADGNQAGKWLRVTRDVLGQRGVAMDASEPALQLPALYLEFAIRASDRLARGEFGLPEQEENFLRVCREAAARGNLVNAEEM